MVRLQFVGLNRLVEIDRLVFSYPHRPLLGGLYLVVFDDLHFEFGEDRIAWLRRVVRIPAGPSNCDCELTDRNAVVVRAYISLIRNSADICVVARSFLRPIEWADVCIGRRLPQLRH